MATYYEVVTGAQNVLKIVFAPQQGQTVTSGEYATAIAPYLTAWGDSSLTVKSGRQIFDGDSSNGSRPYLMARTTLPGTALSSGTGWMSNVGGTGSGETIAESSLSYNFNRLKGDTQYYPLSGDKILYNTPVYCQLGLEVTSSTNVPSSPDLDFYLTVHYAFTGTPPDVQFWFNSKTGGGTDSAASWVQIFTGLNNDQLMFSDTGATSSAVILTKPALGAAAKRTQTLWVYRP